jgi:hypothetical protein
MENVSLFFDRFKPSANTYAKAMTLTIVLLLMFGFGLISNAALADYVLPPIAERYHVITNSWQLSNTGKDYKLSANHNGKEYKWPVDRFLLADRINSDSICTGTADAFTKGYLNSLAQLPPKTDIIIEIVNNKKEAPLVVAGIWVYDSEKQWQHATQFGSKTLSLSADKVKALGSAEKYHKQVLQFCDQEWNRMNVRPATNK